MKVMHNPNSNLWKFTRSYKFGLEALFFLDMEICYFYVGRGFFLAVTLFYLFILESSSFGCAWFDIFKDTMIHIDR